MPSIRYINQSAPFWDFVASLENQEFNHPFFKDRSPREGGPWAWGPQNHWRHRRYDQTNETPTNKAEPSATENKEPNAATLSSTAEGKQPEEAAAQDGDKPCGSSGDEQRYAHCRRGFASRPRRGPCSGNFQPRHCGGGGPSFGRFNMGPLSDFIQAQFVGNDNVGNESHKKTSSNDDFQPEADVFDTESAFVIHVSLPGAKKEDVGVSWDADKNELSVAGVIYRPGDEDFLKTLALNDRKVGAFERKIRLGTRDRKSVV